MAVKTYIALFILEIKSIFLQISMFLTGAEVTSWPLPSVDQSISSTQRKEESTISVSSNPTPSTSPLSSGTGLGSI